MFNYIMKNNQNTNIGNVNTLPSTNVTTIEGSKTIYLKDKPENTKEINTKEEEKTKDLNKENQK